MMNDVTESPHFHFKKIPFLLKLHDKSCHGSRDNANNTWD